MSSNILDLLKELSLEVFECPISLDVMKMPVILSVDGYSYEYSEISQVNKSPMTRKHFSPRTGLFENKALKAAIQNWQNGSDDISPYICPLSKEVMREPMFCLVDGMTYEKAFIESCQCSPINGLLINQEVDLVFNRALAEAIKLIEPILALIEFKQVTQQLIAEKERISLGLLLNWQAHINNMTAYMAFIEVLRATLSSNHQMMMYLTREDLVGQVESPELKGVSPLLGLASTKEGTTLLKTILFANDEKILKTLTREDLGADKKEGTSPYHLLSGTTAGRTLLAKIHQRRPELNLIKPPQKDGIKELSPPARYKFFDQRQKKAEGRQPKSKKGCPCVMQ